jgi:hypothetical protein
MDLSLSSRGLRGIVDEKDFTFKVNGEPFSISTFRAQFLSPAVCRALASDPTLREFEINVPNGTSCFHLFLLLASGETITLPNSQATTFRSLCGALENTELPTLFSAGTATPETITSRLLLYPSDSDLAYACKHFASLDHKMLTFDILERLLSDDRLILTNEDALFKIVKGLIEFDDSFFPLLDYVKCEFLDQTSIADFCSLLSPSLLSSSVWESICWRLSLVVPLPQNQPELTIEFNPSRPFDGIFHSLFERYHKNPHLAGVIAVSAPDEQLSRGYECYDLIDSAPKGRKWWGTSNGNGPHYLRIDFKNFRVCPSRYSVKAHALSCTSGHFLRSWEFEGSHDAETWKSLDRQSDSGDLFGNDRVASYTLRGSEFFRYLQFRPVGVTSDNTHFFFLQQIEVFGSVDQKREGSDVP